MHIIRLRGPWELEPVARFVRRPDGTYRPMSDDLPAGVQAKMPADWAEAFGADFLGRVRYRRTFQKPTGLDERQRVWLVVEAPRSLGVVELNHRRLGEAYWGGQPCSFDIAELLQDHNRLEIVVEHPALDAAGTAKDDSTSKMAGGLVGEVRLEIEE